VTGNPGISLLSPCVDYFLSLSRETEPPVPCSHDQLSFTLASAAELAYGSDSPRFTWLKRTIETWPDCAHWDQLTQLRSIQ